MKTTSNYIIFNPPRASLKELAPDEKKLLPLLTEACKKLHKIYLLQENQQFLGANFYPHDLTKEQIEEAGKSNPSLLDSYTIVEKSSKGDLVAIPYHQKYKSQLKEISRLIEKAAEISKNKTFQDYLQTLSRSIVEGTYGKADAVWLSVKKSNIDFTLSPYETDLDRLLGVKKSYQAHVGIINKKRTGQAQNIKDILYLNPGPKPHHSPDSKLQVQVQDVVIFAGIMASSLFAREHLPTSYETREKYGSKIIGYLTTMDLKFEKLILPVYESIFEKKFRDRYSLEILKKGNYYQSLFYSLAKQLHKYPESKERLKELYPIFDQANNMVAGIQHSKHLILKGVLDQKELEALMITEICWMFAEWVIYKKLKSREVILKGDALVINFLLKSGALNEKDGISWPNFAKMFFEIENLASVFNRFLEEATYQEAKEFLDKYLTFEVFNDFDKRLANIKPL